MSVLYISIGLLLNFRSRHAEGAGERQRQAEREIEKEISHPLVVPLMCAMIKGRTGRVRHSVQVSYLGCRDPTT